MMLTQQGIVWFGAFGICRGLVPSLRHASIFGTVANDSAFQQMGTVSVSALFGIAVDNFIAPHQD